MKLEIALAIPASNEWKIVCKNSKKGVNGWWQWVYHIKYCWPRIPCIHTSEDELVVSVLEWREHWFYAVYLPGERWVSPDLPLIDWCWHRRCPSNARRWPDAELMLDQRLQRWHNIIPAWGQLLVFGIQTGSYPQPDTTLSLVIQRKEECRSYTTRE